MSVAVSVQRAVTGRDTALPDDRQIEDWVSRAARQVVDDQDLQMTIRIVDEAEIVELNKTYRGKDQVTNVLSFPFEAPPGLPAEALEPELGDVVICAAVVSHEAQTQNKSPTAHWAHMIIHGSLHLLGYDHQTEYEAQEMESLEKVVLHELGFADPYAA